MVKKHYCTVSQSSLFSFIIIILSLQQQRQNDNNDNNDDTIIYNTVKTAGALQIPLYVYLYPWKQVKIAIIRGDNEYYNYYNNIYYKNK